MALNLYKSKWPLKPLSEVAEINPKRPAELRNLGDATPVSFVPMASVCEKLGAIKDQIAKPFGELKKGFTYFADGDVLFAKITPCMQNGKSAVASGLVNGLGFGSTEFHVLRPTKSSAEWLYFFVRSQAFRDEAARHFRGSAGQQRVPEDFLRQAKIPDAPGNDQIRIVARIKDCFKHVEQMHSLREDVFSESNFLLSATLRELFSDLAKSATHSTVGAVTTHSQYGTSVKCVSTPSGTPILRIPNVADGLVNLNKMKYASLPEREQEKLKLYRGDMLVVRTNGSPDLVGRCAIFDVDGCYCYASYLIRFRLDLKRVRPQYLSFFLQSPQGRDEIGKIRQTSAGQFNVNSENLRKIPFPLPSLARQDALVKTATEVQAGAAAIRAEVVETDEECLALQEAILREAFAGNL